jgi:hypothetical protein
VNSHKNARLTFEGRKLLIERIEQFRRRRMPMRRISAVVGAASPPSAGCWGGRSWSGGTGGGL